LPASHSPASPGDLEIHHLERLLSPRIRPASTSRGRLLLTEGGGLLPAEAGAASGEPELSR
jgi:hypothetical protein